ncbi:outer envelope protein 61-like [Phalaenopsis equestris]|uniref:outer envelope protein 61-like n=1 Tax=Phalaenopsis equestris TaxID=78828 RepID=UPI0009E3B70D|nr:outer envelope protein 61-like [Phalaenopsis equestris]
MFSNPELMKLATESMKNMKPEDVKLAAEQLKHTKHEDIAELTEKMANASPEELASLQMRAEAQISYQISAAEMLKKQGNELHANMEYHEAANKYLRAKGNLKGIPSTKSSTLKLQCSLNLMSCYLKTMQYEDCVKEGSEILKNDSKNVKALYRRGQAYKELGKLEAAVSDLSVAYKISPEDETIAGVLRDAKEILMKDGGASTSQGVVIEEIDEVESRTVPSNCHSTAEYSVMQPVEGCESNPNDGSYGEVSAANSEALRTLKENPETIRLFQKYVSNADAESISAMGLGKMSPEMIRTATDMISSMKAEELQKMLEAASSLKGNGSPFSNMNGHGMTPEMIRMASEKISSMPPEELKKMYEFSSSFNGNSMKAASVFNSQRSESASQSSVATVNATAGTRNISGLPSSSTSSAPPTDLQEAMRNSMKDPAMRQMFASMVKNMSPEMMTSMSEQFGMKLSKDDAAKAQQAMASLSPEDLDRMMRWAERAQKGFEIAKKTKHWLLGRPGMLLAIVMLVLAFLLHQLGYIGS